MRKIRGVLALLPMACAVHAAGSGLGRGGVAFYRHGMSNGPAHPAPRGSVVRIYGTGFGPTQPAELAGGIVTDRSVVLAQAPETFIGNTPAAVISAVQAPFAPPGVIELQVRVPDQLPAAFQSVANIQFRQGLYIVQTNAFIWVQ